MLTLTPADLPSTFRAADTASLAGQRAAVRWRAAQLSLLLLAAVAGTFTWRLDGEGSPVAALAGGAFAAALVCERARAAARPERLWYRGRAGAESIKTLAWKYAVGGTPFAVGPGVADDLFLAGLGGVTRELADVDWVGESDAVSQQITPGMRSLRRSGLADRKVAYRRYRIDDQRRWYASKAAGARTDARRWSNVVTVATSIGLAGAAADALGLLRLPILGLASACAAAAAAWTQFRQHDALASAYGVAASELLLVDERLSACADEATWSRLVHESEEAISREHTMWTARRDMRLAV